MLTFVGDTFNKQGNCGELCANTDGAVNANACFCIAGTPQSGFASTFFATVLCTAGQVCNKGIDPQCTTVPACGNTDGTGVNAQDCVCGNAICTQILGNTCVASSNTCSELPLPCANTHATELNNKEATGHDDASCVCGTTICPRVGKLCKSADNTCPAAPVECTKCETSAGTCVCGTWVCAAGETCVSSITNLMVGAELMCKGADEAADIASACNSDAQTTGSGSAASTVKPGIRGTIVMLLAVFGPAALLYT